MKINVNFSSQIKRQANLTSLTIEVDPACSIPALVHGIVSDCGDPLRQFILDKSGNVHPSLIIVMNDRRLDPNQPVEFNDGDTIELLSPIAGG